MKAREKRRVHALTLLEFVLVENVVPVICANQNRNKFLTNVTNYEFTFNRTPSDTTQRIYVGHRLNFEMEKVPAFP